MFLHESDERFELRYVRQVVDEDDFLEKLRG